MVPGWKESSGAPVLSALDPNWLQGGKKTFLWAKIKAHSAGIAGFPAVANATNGECSLAAARSGK